VGRVNSAGIIGGVYAVMVVIIAALGFVFCRRKRGNDYKVVVFFKSKLSSSVDEPHLTQPLHQQQSLHQHQEG
jgi:hypothetical protein